MLSLDKTLELRDSQILDAQRFKAILWQRRWMAFSIVLSIVIQNIF